MHCQTGTAKVDLAFVQTQPGPRIRQLQTNCYAPVLRFPAPLYVVRFSRKYVWNNMQAYM